jgi:hypothetical protein
MENKINFRYITLEELSNGLQISLNAAGIELVKELKEDGKYEFDIWYELFEDVHGNSEYIFHNDMGESGFGLTNAEGITDGYFISDNGDGYDTNYPESAKVYWFPNYMVINSLDKMFEEGKVFFNKAEDNIVELLGFTIPTWAASALINSDESGLNDEDIEKLNKFVNKIVDKYGNANFMIGSDEEMESQFASRNDIDGFLGGDVVRMYLRPTKEYAKGGGVNTGRSWHLDRQKRNKSESWEKPMSKRKQRYDVGGGVEEISVGNAQDLMKFWSNPENESKKVFFVEEMDNEDGTDTYYVVGNQTKRDYEDSQYWDYDYNFNNIDDAIKQAKMDAEKNNAVYMDNRRVTKKYSKGGGVNSGRSWHLDRQKRNKSESWEKPMSKRKQRYDVGGGVGDKYKYIKLYNERSDKAIKDSIKETGEAPEDSWDWIEQEGGFTAEEIAGYYLESYKDKALSTWLENVKDSIGHDTDEKVTKILKEVSGVSYGKGGGINSGRDLLFKSQEPHEQAYKRKREFKKYGDKGNWFSDFFKDGGSVFVSPHVIAMHDYILKSYGFLLPNEGESGYDKFTYSDFAEELKSNYDIKNPRNKQVYDYLIHLGNVSMFSGNVSDMKKVEERMSTADVKYANGGGVGESKTYKINNTTAIEDEVNKYLHSLKLKDGYSNNMGTFTAKLTEQQLNQLISLIIKVDKNDNVYILDSVNKVVYDSEDTSAGTAWRTGKYANGGGIDKRDSWHSDRRQFNKNESWEKPMSQRKEIYANGGGVGQDLEKTLLGFGFYRSNLKKNKSKKVIYWKHLKNSKGAIAFNLDAILDFDNNEITINDGWGRITKINSPEQLIEYYNKLVSVTQNHPYYSTLGIDGSSSMENGGGVDKRDSWHSDRRQFNKSESWEKPMSKRKQRYASGGGVGDKVFCTSIEGDFVTYPFLEIGKEYEISERKIEGGDQQKTKYVRLVGEGNTWIEFDKCFSENKYSKGGGVKKRSLMSMANLVVADWRAEKIKDWYIKNHPTDDLGEELNDDVTFEDLWNGLHNKTEVYSIMGVGDSVIRERLFERLSEIYGVDYNVIYKKWLGVDEYANGGGVDEIKKINIYNIVGDKEKLILISDKSGSAFSLENNGKSVIDIINEFDSKFKESFPSILGTDFIDEQYYTHNIGAKFDYAKGLIKNEDAYKYTPVVILTDGNEDFSDAPENLIIITTNKGKEYVKHTRPNLENVYTFDEIYFPPLFGNGGNVGRDLIFKSKQKWEQDYDRKREWKEYKKEGWFSKWFEEGGSVAEDGGGISMIGNDVIVTGISTLKDVLQEIKEKNKKLEFELDGRFFTIYDIDNNRIHVLVHTYDGSEERKSYVLWETINDRKFPDEKGLHLFYDDYDNDFYFKLTDKQRAEHPYNNWMHQKADMEDKMRDMEDAMMEDGGGVKRSVTAYLGEVISTNTAEMALGRKINSWKDEVITIDGISYRKVYLKPEYKQI